MFQRNVVDLFGSTFFNFKQGIKEQIISEIKTLPYEKYSAEDLIMLLGGLGDDDIDYYKDKNYAKACEIAVLRFCLEDSDIASELLSKENYEKALQMFARKNYDGKLLKELLEKFVKLVHRCRLSTHNGNDCVKDLRLFLLRDISREYNALREEEAEKAFSELKKEIDKIASGVKTECYFDAEKEDEWYLEERIGDDANVSSELNKFIKEKYGYNLNRYNYCYKNAPCSIIFKRALLDNEDFWKAHGEFNVFTFVESVRKKNDERRAQKILSHIFDNIIKHEIGAKLIEDNLSLIFLFKQKFLETIKSNTFGMAFSRFDGAYDLTKIQDEVLCYPLLTCGGIDEKIAKGKDIIDGLFKTLYPNDSKRIIDFFNEQLAESQNPYKAGGYTIREFFISFTFGYWFTGEKSYEYRAARVYCPEYFTAENLWKKLYLIAHTMSVLESNIQKCYANLFEILYNFFKLIEWKFGLKTSFQKDTAGRDGAYLQLKQTLKKYGVEITDKSKSDYITSLLDRKVAVIEEIERFPALEQLGDAVYGFAVAEMMFYQPVEVEDDCPLKDFEHYVCAEKQVELARMLGIDKLYISSHSLSYKNGDGVLLGDEAYGDNGKFKFLADSLEMVIGTVCKDLGYQAAIDLTKAVLREKHPDTFKQELHWENRDEADPETEVDWEYWNRIYSSPFPYYTTYSSGRHAEAMWSALNKFMLTYVIGTDEVEKRNFISHRYSRAENGDKLYGKNTLTHHNINYVMFDYLHNGLKYVVEKYSAEIKENYKNSEKEEY